jgi:hypothetical protein
LAQLTFKRAINNDPTQLADRVGTLQLIDSDGRQVCDIATDVIVGRLVARQLLVIDPNSQPRVIAATETQPAFSLDEGGPVTYQGVIYLNNQRLGMRLAPPVSQPPASEQPPAAGPENAGTKAETPEQGSNPPAQNPD